MAHAVRVHKVGGPEALVYEQVEVGAPGQGQIKLKQHAIGVNYIDVYQRTGLYPQAGVFSPGNEGAGEVMAVGPGVTDLKVGDRVAYAGAIGGYATERLIAADRVVKLPDAIDYKTAAAMMLKDLVLAQGAAQATGTATPLGAEAAALYRLYVGQGEAGRDFSGIVQFLRGK